MRLDCKNMINTANKMTQILSQKTSSALVLTLNNPKALNALTPPMILTLTEKLKAARDSSTKLVILKSSEERAFCAGGDVRSLIAAPEKAHEFFKAEYQLKKFMSLLWRCN